MIFQLISIQFFLTSQSRLNSPKRESN